jgi:hypothetical protein
MSQTPSEFGAGSPFLCAARISRVESAYFVLARRGKAPSLCPIARSARGGRRSRASLAQHGGARSPMLAARRRDPANICRFKPMW